MGRQRFVAEWFQWFLTHAPDGRRGEAQRGFHIRIGATLLAVRIQRGAAKLIEHGQSGGVVALLLHVAACYPHAGVSSGRDRRARSAVGRQSRESVTSNQEHGLE